jgi:hypothetical protein
VSRDGVGADWTIIGLDAEIDRLVVSDVGIAPERLARLQPRIERALEAALQASAGPASAADVNVDRIELPPLGERALADEDALVHAVAQALARTLRGTEAPS